MQDGGMWMDIPRTSLRRRPGDGLHCVTRVSMPKAHGETGNSNDPSLRFSAGQQLVVSEVSNFGFKGQRLQVGARTPRCPQCMKIFFELT